MHRIGIANSPYCQYCHNVEETTEHFLYDCPEHEEIRNKIFGTNTIKISDMDLLQIANYCRATKRFKIGEEENDTITE